LSSGAKRAKNQDHGDAAHVGEHMGFSIYRRVAGNRSSQPALDVSALINNLKKASARLKRNRFAIQLAPLYLEP
jgi:hypothetical protein